MSKYRLYDIVKYRSLGYQQQEIADKLGISRKTVENRLKELKELSKQKDDINEFYLEVLLRGDKA